MIERTRNAGAAAANGYRRFFSALTLVAVSFSAHAATCTTHDLWTGDDKNLHFAAGVVIAAAGTAYTDDPRKGFYLGTAAGVAKEVYDAFDARECSLQDLAVAAAGAAAGAYLGHLISPAFAENGCRLRRTVLRTCTLFAQPRGTIASNVSAPGEFGCFSN
jgi:uncharacterized protein YfiM (DUF2279 family)